MKPVITRHNNTWRVHVGNHLTGVWATEQRAQQHVRNIAEQPARQRAYRELERARLALERMENNR